MKALTIYQPWASLIMAGAKPYEFRKWSPRERGGAYAALIGERIVIHASQRPIDRREVVDLIDRLNAGGQEMASTALLRDKAMPILQRALDRDLVLGNHGDLPWSSGLGTAVLGEPKSADAIADEFRLVKMNDSDRYEHANWGWPMLDIETWDVPIPMPGFQGFWTWPTAIQFAEAI